MVVLCCVVLCCVLCLVLCCVVLLCVCMCVCKRYGRTFYGLWMYMQSMRERYGTGVQKWPVRQSEKEYANKNSTSDTLIV